MIPANDTLSLANYASLCLAELQANGLRQLVDLKLPALALFCQQGMASRGQGPLFGVLV